MWRTLIVAGVAAVVTFLVAAAAASAHVTVRPDEAVVGVVLAVRRSSPQ